MSTADMNVIYLKDYLPPAFEIESLDLTFRLFEDGALVIAKQAVSKVSSDITDFVLHGEELELRSLKIDGRELDSSEYLVESEFLAIKAVPERFVLECETWIKPQDNKRLEGLYKSSTMFCTQCEAEGFRRITYYLDRPDVMTLFTTRIEADKALYPNLLSNGNLVDKGDFG